MFRIIFLVLFALGGSFLQAQTINSTDLNKINGKWKGTLSYTDYQDDVTKYTIKCEMVAACKNKKGVLTIKYTEPNGEVIQDKIKLRIKKKGTKLIFEGKTYQVLDFDPDEKMGTWLLTMGNSDRDNNRDSAIKQLFHFQGDQMTFTKMVKYDGTDTYFERNKYSFTSQK